MFRFSKLGGRVIIKKAHRVINRYVNEEVIHHKCNRRPISFLLNEYTKGNRYHTQLNSISRANQNNLEVQRKTILRHPIVHNIFHLSRSSLNHLGHLNLNPLSQRWCAHNHYRMTSSSITNQRELYNSHRHNSGTSVQLQSYIHQIHSIHNIPTKKRSIPLTTNYSTNSSKTVKDIIYNQISKMNDPISRKYSNKVHDHVQNPLHKNHSQEVPIISKLELENIILTRSSKKAMPYYLIDVRNSDEFAKQRIPTARHIPLNDLPKALSLSREDFTEQFGFNKWHDRDKLIFYCTAGVRSELGCKLAIRHGLKNVYNYKGSVMEWFGKNFIK